MKYIKNNVKGDDIIMTPKLLCGKITAHYNPTGSILEPCKGNGNWLEFLPNADWCELSEGKDFFNYTNKVDWIITNPPWSQFANFLEHALELADNIVFLTPVNHWWTKKRLRLLKENCFGFVEFLLVDTPKEFPQMGFQLGAVYVRRGWRGKAKINYLESMHKEV